MDFREYFEDWIDWDVAAFFVGLLLGVFPEGVEFSEVKYVFWSANAVGEFLHGVLEGLVRVGVLEVRDEPDLQFRVKR